MKLIIFIKVYISSENIKLNSNRLFSNLKNKNYTIIMPHYPREIEYSDKYFDDFYEYRHVILPKNTYQKMPRGRIL